MVVCSGLVAGVGLVGVSEVRPEMLTKDLSQVFRPRASRTAISSTTTAITMRCTKSFSETEDRPSVALAHGPMAYG